jgi:phosphatidate cytidylyltransferase
MRSRPVVSALLLDLLALAYIVSGFGHAILLRSATRFGLGFQILGLSCAWICDSGALVAGNFLGHRKLAPIVSPGKTIVGAVAGVASSVATVVLFFRLPTASAFEGFLPLGVSLMEQFALGLVLGVLCILGDLIESLLKRVADTKDSGTFFPGHGGCLDRMDSFLFIAPALFYYSSFRFSVQ